MIDKNKILGLLGDGFSEMEPDDHDFEIASRGISIEDIPELRKLVFITFCGAFATFIWQVLLTLGAAAPDWGMSEDYLLLKIRRWERWPIIFSLCNPLWLAGYPLTCLMVLEPWFKLKKEIIKNVEQKKYK